MNKFCFAKNTECSQQYFGVLYSEFKETQFLVDADHKNSLLIRKIDLVVYSRKYLPLPPINSIEYIFPCIFFYFLFIHIQCININYLTKAFFFM